MTDSTHEFFLQAVKDAAHEVAEQLMVLDGIPHELWEQIPEEFFSTNEEGDRVLEEDRLKEWFDRLFETDNVDFVVKIAEFADLCDIHRRRGEMLQEQAASLAPTE